MTGARPRTAARPNARSDDVGVLLRAWRDKRRLSQLALALDTGVSARHLSFVETGRSRPSATLVAALAERMQVPLRERNRLMLAAGYAPRYTETPLDADALGGVKRALQRLLDAHDPYPGVALDRHWNVVLANRAATRLVALLPATLAGPPLNLFRASLHPEGFAARTANFAEWGRYLLGVLRRIESSAVDPVASALLEEVGAYPNVRALTDAPPLALEAERGLLVSCELALPDARLALFTTLATLGLPRDITLAELTVELFYPADEATGDALRRLAR
jgi:transcriptional regulator with XRE-family HTH domain